MMKKIGAVLCLLFLVACDRMSGESYTSCTGIADGLAGVNVGTTEVTVQGYDEEILVWTVYTTLTREELNEEFLNDRYLSDDEIHEWFEMYSETEIDGINFHVSELTNEYIVIAKVYDYSLISTTYLNNVWNVENFEDAVTLSSAIAGLRDQGATCEIIEIVAEIEEETE